MGCLPLAESWLPTSRRVPTVSVALLKPTAHGARSVPEHARSIGQRHGHPQNSLSHTPEYVLAVQPTTFASPANRSDDRWNTAPERRIRCVRRQHADAMRAGRLDAAVVIHHEVGDPADAERAGVVHELHEVAEYPWLSWTLS